MSGINFNVNSYFNHRFNALQANQSTGADGSHTQGNSNQGTDTDIEPGIELSVQEILAQGFAQQQLDQEQLQQDGDATGLALQVGQIGLETQGTQGEQGVENIEGIGQAEGIEERQGTGMSAGELQGRLLAFQGGMSGAAASDYMARFQAVEQEVNSRIDMAQIAKSEHMYPNAVTSLSKGSESIGRLQEGMLKELQQNPNLPPDAQAEIQEVLEQLEPLQNRVNTEMESTLTEMGDNDGGSQTKQPGMEPQNQMATSPVEMNGTSGDGLFNPDMLQMQSLF